MAYSQAVADEICRRLAEGESLLSICKDPEMPARSVVYEWLDANVDGFADRYARARSVGNAAEFESLAEIADAEPERGPDGKVDPGWVAWQRNRVDVRKWTLARKEPKKYGDKIEHEHRGGVTVTLSSQDESL